LATFVQFNGCVYLHSEDGAGSSSWAPMDIVTTLSRYGLTSYDVHTCFLISFRNEQAGRGVGAASLLCVADCAGCMNAGCGVAVYGLSKFFVL
jgi:hypothetical protein